ncbi:MAG: hypothetical protein P1V97_13170, partial [Planctomycetota bacterium]|nr:hypothetical protein [Planctomycetota bacterium]
IALQNLGQYAGRDPQAKVRIASLKVIKQLGVKGAAVLYNVTLAFSFQDPLVRVAAIDTFMNLGPAVKSSVYRLTRTLTDSDARVRIKGLQAFKKLAPLVQNYAYSLRASLSDENETARKAALSALGQMGSSGASVIAGVLRGNDTDLRENVLNALKTAEFPPETLIPTLFSVLGTKDAELRGIALDLLIQYAPKTDDVLPGIIKSLRDDDLSIGAKA